MEKHSVSRLSYLFAHLHLLSSYSFSSTLLSSNLSLLYASSLLCFSSLHIVGSLTSKLPSITDLLTGMNHQVPTFDSCESPSCEIVIFHPPEKPETCGELWESPSPETNRCQMSMYAKIHSSPMSNVSSAQYPWVKTFKP